MIRKYEAKDLTRCAEIFRQAFSEETWGCVWSQERAEKYIYDFTQNPQKNSSLLSPRHRKQGWKLTQALKETGECNPPLCQLFWHRGGGHFAYVIFSSQKQFVYQRFHSHLKTVYMYTRL